MSADLGGSFHRAAKWTPRVPRTLAALRGPTTWKSEVPQTLGRFRVCRDMETASSPDLGSGFETPQVPETCELVCIVMETPSSPRFPRVVKCGNPWFHQGRDMETPSFPGLGVTWKTPSPRRLGRRRLRSWRDMETASFPRPGRDLETPSFPRLGRRRFRSWRDSETPSFPGLGAAGFGRGATWKPQVSPGLGAT